MTIDAIASTLVKPLDVSQLSDLIELREPLLAEVVKLQKDFYVNREKLRVPKGKEYTDFDRSTMLEAYVAESREKYEYAKGLQELVKERIELYKLMLGDK